MRVVSVDLECNNQVTISNADCHVAPIVGIVEFGHIISKSSNSNLLLDSISSNHWFYAQIVILCK